MGTSENTGRQSDWHTLKSITFIGNYLPRQCGIATYTTHLLEAVAANAPDKDCWAVAMDDRPESYDYPAPVRFRIDQNKLGKYSLVADRVNHAQTDIVCLQHEFGIFGGLRGGYILELLRELKTPVVTTLHTILKDPGTQERNIIVQLAELSDRLVVMSRRSVEFLRDVYEVPAEKIALIFHGIPDIPFVEPDHYKDKFGVSGKKVIMTFGLLSPDKGIETVIEALPEIVRKYPQVIYMVVGATHPHQKAEHGEEYRTSLYLQAKRLGVENHLAFHNRFIGEEEVPKFIGAADIYVTPYRNEAQIISGTLAYAMGMGRAVVSTPYWHAQELLAGNRGQLFPFGDHVALAQQIIDLLDHPDKLQSIRKRAYDYGRDMIWSETGKRYLDVFAEAKQQYLSGDKKRVKKTIPGRRPQPLPELNLDHMVRMTDGAGILQHAKYSIPDREHGYCVDDNARALIVAVRSHNLHKHDSFLVDLITVYLSFLDHAFNNRNDRFRNFMSYDRNWLEEAGSEDSYGRALWGLGFAAAFGRNEGQTGLAADLFRQSLKAAEDFMSPRAAAFTIIGIHAFLSGNRTDEQAERICRKLSERLVAWFKNSASDDWPWFEDTLTYDSARLSQALLLSGRLLDDPEMLQIGLRSLAWLQKIQINETRTHFVAIGNHGWYKKGGDKARFDQQPIEAAAMVDACIEAYECTHDEKWINDAYSCLNWYLGENDLHEPLYDHSTGGCRDGLGADGLNQNQGAESTLCCLAAILALYEYRGRT